MGNRDISRLSPAAQRKIQAELLKSKSGANFGDIMRKAERDGIRFTIPLNPVTKKNSQRIVNCGKYRKILPSEAYAQYEEAAKPFLPGRGLKLDRLCEVRGLFYMKTRRKVDLTNLLEALDDVLVAHGVLADDDSEIIGSHDGSRVRHDKDNPRTEVTIRFMDREDL